MQSLKHFFITLLTVSLLTSCADQPPLLENINLSDGQYALYVKHKTAGEFMVTDVNALRENQSALIVDISFANYLPGEGDRSYGVMLFKDNKLVKHTLGGVFNAFEIGSLASYKRGVKIERFHATKEAMQRKIALLEKNSKSFISQAPKINKGDQEFSFWVQFPHIALPVTRGKDKGGTMHIETVNGIAYAQWIQKDESLFRKAWEQQITSCIKDKATTDDYIVNIAQGSLSDAYLFATADQHSGYLKTPDGKTITVHDYLFYDFAAHIHTNEALAKQLMILDFSDCISEAQRKRPQLLAKVDALVKTSTRPRLNVMDSEVGISDYKDNISVSKKLYEQEYQLNWLALQ